MSQASVQSIQALKDFRVALAMFAEEAMGALGGVDMEVRRTQNWLEHDRRMYWVEQIKRRKEKLSMAQSELHRKKMSEMFGHSASYSEQKEALKKAEDRLREAEYRAMMVKKLLPVLQQAILVYHSQTRRLIDLAGGELPRSLALLDRLIDALEAYTHVAPPPGAVFNPFRPAPESAPSAAAGTSVSSAATETAAEPPATEAPGEASTTAAAVSAESQVSDQEKSETPATS